MYQGCDEPIVVQLVDTDDAGQFEEIHAVLYSGRNTLKHWTKEDMEISGDVIMLPLTQTESALFTIGVAKLEINVYDGEQKIPCETAKIQVRHREDKHILGGD